MLTVGQTGAVLLAEGSLVGSPCGTLSAVALIKSHFPDQCINTKYRYVVCYSNAVKSST